MTEQEYALYTELPQNVQGAEASLRWSLKEAYLKAVGTGVKSHPRTVETHIDRESGNVSISRDGQTIPMTTHWTVYKNTFILVNTVL